MKKLIFSVVLAGAILTASNSLEAQFRLFEDYDNRLLERWIEAGVGPKAVDCGRLRVNAEEAAVTKALKCVQAVNKRRQPFRLIKQEQGIDTLAGYGLLGKGDGKMIFFKYDLGFYGWGLKSGSCESVKTVAQRNRFGFECEPKAVIF